MLFLRRNREPLISRLRVMLWPRRTWTRSVDYLRKRIIRMNESPHTVAIGFAAGVFSSFTPFVGLHFLLAALIAWPMRGSLLASAIGTFVGNPITFPLIWTSTFVAGRWLLGIEGHVQTDISPLTILTEQGLSWHAVWQVFLPMCVGALVLGPIASVAAYFITRMTVSRYRLARERMLRRRAANDSEPLSASAADKKANDIGESRVSAQNITKPVDHTPPLNENQSKRSG